MRDMEPRLLQQVHEDSGASPAPGELDLVREFLSLHDHMVGMSESLEPAPETLDRWLKTKGLVEATDALTEKDLAWAFDVREALVAKVLENMGEPIAPATIERLNDAVARTGLRPRFGDPHLCAASRGIEGAIGQLLGIAFLAELDGSWHRLRRCASPTCTSVFYDRSKNHSAKWCSMRSCGNRNKVRAFRERRGASAP